MKKFIVMVMFLTLLFVTGCFTSTRTVTFNSDGGSYVAPITVSYGKTIEEPTPPTKLNYDFVGWYYEDEKFDFSSKIINNITLKAVWEEAEVIYNEYTVVFEDYDGTIIDEQVVQEGKNAIEPKEPVRDGYIFIGWSASIKNIRSDLTVVAQYQKRSAEEVSYTVTFKNYDGTVLKTEVVKEGEDATAPEDPVRDGYIFIGWNDSFNNVVKDVVVTAMFQQEVVYTVTFKDYDGTILGVVTVEEGDAATAPTNPERDGYIFVGWNKAFDNITSDLIVTALYQEKSQETVTYTVTFKDHNGTVLKTETVEEGENATAPTSPSRAGYVFKGWDKSYTNVVGDLVVTAVYEEITKYTVIFKDYDGTVLKTETVEEGKNATAPAAPTREGYVFTGWNKAFTNVTSNLTIIAVYTSESEQTYTVTFIDYNGTTLKTEKVKKGNDATPPSDPTRSNYLFTGWTGTYTNVTSNVTVRATYVSKDVEYNITYNLNGGVWGYSSKNDYVSAFLNDFYAFVKPTETLQVFMHGEGNYTGFDGTWSNYIGGSVGETNKLLYENDGSLDNNEYFFNSSTYKAKWANLVEWVAAQNHRFNGTGGYEYGALDFYRYIINDPAGYINIYGENFYSYPSLNEPTQLTYKYSTTDIKLHTPLNSMFIGWYLDSEFSGEPVTKIEAGTIGNIELFACYNTATTYEIYFNTDGAGTIDPLTVSVNQSVTLKTDLKKDGYTFVGWYYGNTYISSPFTFVYPYSITLTAKWRSNDVTLQNLSYDGTTVKYRNSSTVVQIPSDYVQPETQLRAAWVSSYAGNFTPSANEANMKANLTEILDLMESYNMNCMIFHIRTTNNAFYQTDLAPIQSNYGTYESFNNWDYLEWLINECHKRGMEFHAWLNPYRIKAYGYAADATTQDVANAYADYPKNPASDPDNILLTYRSDGTKGAILNPYEEEVQDYIVDVCLEVMEKYDVDAIHFDDYFYAQMSSGITVLTEPDQDDYEEYINANPSSGYSKTNATHKKQWRRDNIDNFIYKLHNAMTEFNKTEGRGVQLGISPTGIYRNGNGSVTSGSNTAGQEHYNSYLFCDTVNWVNNEWIDYIMPQSYWAFTHKVAGYADVMDWWNLVVEGKDVNLYSGLGLYMSVDGGNYSWGTQPYEISNQILYTTKLSNVKGVSIYSFASLRTVNASSSQIAYQGLMKVKNEYWTTKVDTPTTAASQYIK